MNEEEKKAIEILQYTIEINQNILDGIEIDEQVIKSMETTLNLIDKQQKVIDEMAKKLVDLQIPISQEENIMFLNYVKKFFYKKIEKKQDKF